MRRLAWAVVLVVLGAGVALAQRDFSDVEIKATQVAGHVYMLEGAGGNIGVSGGEDGVVIVIEHSAIIHPRNVRFRNAVDNAAYRFMFQPKRREALMEFLGIFKLNHPHGLMSDSRGIHGLASSSIAE